MLYIGIAHLSFRRIEFQAQVPVWLTTDEFWIDFVVIVSGYIEIIFGIMMIIGGKLKVKTGIALAAFYIIIFPGNINQYIHEIDALRLYSEKQRILRLLFQPVLVFWALWSTGSLRLFFKK
jgi:uncharacterized membrane protein